jgi:RNA recognition motif-containing protein
VTKLSVGNLPFTATEESVPALFAPYGTIEKVSLITDRDSGRPCGFGFVEMSNADASRAMQALNGPNFDGRPSQGQRGAGARWGRGPRRY